MRVRLLMLAGLAVSAAVVVRARLLMLAGSAVSAAAVVRARLLMLAGFTASAAVVVLAAAVFAAASTHAPAPAMPSHASSPIHDRAVSTARDQPAHDQPARDQPARDQPAHDQPVQDQPAHDQPAHDQPVIGALTVDWQSTWSSAAIADSSPAVPMPGARVVFVPHHAPAGHLAATMLRDLSKTVFADASSSWERVVMIGPDHKKAGAKAATTCAATWATPFGQVRSDASAVRHLAGSAAAAQGCQLLAHEHSIGEVVPLVARYMPGAVVVPLAVRADANRAERAALVSALRDIVDDRTAVVVSADFAHDVAPHMARRNDAESIAALESFDFSAIAGFGDEHLDARAATMIAMELARNLGATEFVLRERTDGTALIGYSGGPLTSYVTGYYTAP